MRPYTAFTVAIGVLVAAYLFVGGGHLADEPLPSSESLCPLAEMEEGHVVETDEGDYHVIVTYDAGETAERAISHGVYDTEAEAREVLEEATEDAEEFREKYCVDSDVSIGNESAVKK